MKKEEFDKLVKKYIEMVNYNNSLEYESAPSGEFEEYNCEKLKQEAIVETMEEIFEILGIKIINSYDENGICNILKIQFKNFIYKKN